MATLSYEAVRDYAVELEQANERLRTQLREAQEERDEYESRWSEVLARQNRIVGERLAAIERGVRACNFLSGYANNCLQLIRALEARHCRAVAAEADAKAKGTLAQERGELVYEIDRWCWQWGRPTGWSDRAKHALRRFTPAKAPESPQGGQEEAD